MLVVIAGRQLQPIWSSFRRRWTASGHRCKTSINDGLTSFPISSRPFPARPTLRNPRLTEITAARASVGQVKLDPNSAPTDPAKLAAFESAQGQLSSALSRLLVVVERYPDLKATANFQDLQAQLEGTENRISVERRDFNTAVQNYNTAIKSFPAVFYAGMFGFSPKPYFTATPGAETPPKVQFDFNQAAPATKP